MRTLSRFLLGAVLLLSLMPAQAATRFDDDDDDDDDRRRCGRRCRRHHRHYYTHSYCPPPAPRPVWCWDCGCRVPRGVRYSQEWPSCGSHYRRSRVPFHRRPGVRFEGGFPIQGGFLGFEVHH